MKRLDLYFYALILAFSGNFVSSMIYASLDLSSQENKSTKEQEESLKKLKLYYSKQIELAKKRILYFLKKLKNRRQYKYNIINKLENEIINSDFLGNLKQEVVDTVFLDKHEQLWSNRFVKLLNILGKDLEHLEKRIQLKLTPIN